MSSSNTCDMHMCRLGHINDPVLSSLKMEGVRSVLFFLPIVMMQHPKKTGLFKFSEV
jgi:hypothetical protein